MIFIISWHCSLGGNFLADTLRYLSWPALSRSWHLAASGMGLGVMSHQAGLLTTLHHIHICFPEQGGNMVTTMGWGFSDFRHLFCFTLLINKACMYHNHIPLMYIFNSPAHEFWVSFPLTLEWAQKQFVTRVHALFLFLTRHNESKFDDKNDLYTSFLCLTRSVFVLLVTSQSIADDITMIRHLWRDHVNSDI